VSDHQLFSAVWRARPAARDLIPIGAAYPDSEHSQFHVVAAPENGSRAFDHPQ
jgi:hypothetical protein